MFMKRQVDWAVADWAKSESQVTFMQFLSKRWFDATCNLVIYGTEINLFHITSTFGFIKSEKNFLNFTQLLQINSHLLCSFR